MSRAEMLAAKARLETCRNCKRWKRWDESMGRCGKYNKRIVMMHEFGTCEHWVKRKERE